MEHSKVNFFFLQVSMSIVEETDLPNFRKDGHGGSGSAKYHEALKARWLPSRRLPNRARQRA